MNPKTTFEWDDKKNEQNIKKHSVSFFKAQFAFKDKNRVILEDLSHSRKEKRYYCLGMVDEEILTVRFTYRRKKIRIFGAGSWRNRKKIYEKQNQTHK